MSYMPKKQLSLELKPLPNHLKYVYLDNKQRLPVIISNKLLELLNQVCSSFEESKPFEG